MLNKIFKIVLLLPLFLVGFSSITFSQEEDDEKTYCDLKYIPTDKKALKYYNNYKNTKKYSYPEQFQEMKKAIEIDGNCAPCIWKLAKRSFLTAKTSKSPNYKNPIKYYKMLIDVCPNYHADIYYNLGLIAYQEKRDEDALRYFKQFLDFDSDEEKRYNKDYETQLYDVATVVEELEFSLHFYNNPVPFNPVLIQNVSTDKQEYLPILSPDNELLFFTRKYDRKNLGDIVSTTIEELVVSNSTGKMSYNDGKPMKAPFNQPEYSSYGGVSITPNNRKMYVCACKFENGYKNCDLYTTDYIKSEDRDGKTIYIWTPLENLGPNVNGAETWESQPSISADGKTLYYAKIGPNTMAHDIYYSEKQKDGTWGVGKSIGNVINYEGDDKSPFIHSDGKTLYFVSRVNLDYGRYGAGDYDIFYSRFDDEKGAWGKPKNIGYPINTSGNEEGLTVSLDGRKAFFFSDKQPNKVGGRDIYSFEIPEEARPDKVALIKGTITFETEEQKEDAKIEIHYANEEEKVTELDIDSDEEGNYVAVINLGKEPQDVLLTVKSEGAAFESKIIKKDVALEKDPPIIEGSNLEVKTLKEGGDYTIKEILYETSSADIEEKSKLILRGFAIYLKQNPSLKVEIQGHTDNVGVPSENLTLSKERAKNVMVYLISKGVSKERLTSQGFGQTKPKVSNSSSKNRALNRRTDFVIKQI